MMRELCKRQNREVRRKQFNEKENQPLKLMKRTEVCWEQPRNRDGEKHRCDAGDREPASFKLV